MSLLERIRIAIAGRGGASRISKRGISLPVVFAAPEFARSEGIEALIENLPTNCATRLNWRSSIVDLLRLLDIDPSIENRRKIALEMGYTGSIDDSAEMNRWLHKQVMRKLEQSARKESEDRLIYG